MTILITGGAGFIGSNFIDYLLEKYTACKVICIDALTYAGKMSNLTKALQNDRFRFIKADICSKTAVFEIFQEYHPDIIVNFAAESHVDRSISSPDIFLKTNILGTSVLLDACLKFGITRFHQISTDEVYGDLPLDRPELKFTEASPLKPSSPYSSSKASADLVCLAYHKTYGLSVTISRCSNNYGPNQLEEKLIPLMITNAYKNKPLPVYGNGLNIRDWLYVSDHCCAIDAVIRKGKAGEVYNIGGNCEKSNIDIVKLICRKLNRSEDLIQYVDDRKGHDLRYAIDFSKISSQLGWRPTISFDEGIERTISLYVNKLQGLNTSLI